MNESVDGLVREAYRAAGIVDPDKWEMRTTYDCERYPARREFKYMKQVIQRAIKHGERLGEMAERERQEESWIRAGHKLQERGVV